MLNFRVFLVGALLFVCFLSCKEIHKSPKKDTNRVTNDSLVVLYEHGLLDAIHAQYVKAPAYWGVELRIVYLAPEGSFVTPGDTLVKLDKTPFLDKLDDARAKLEIAQEEMKDLNKQNEEIIFEKLNVIEGLRMQYQIDSSKLANAQFESEITRQDLQLELEKTRLELERAYKDLQTQKVINRTQKTLKIVKLRQARAWLEQALTRLKNLNLVATQSGIVVYSHSGQRGRIREGATVFPGQSLLKVADLNKMKAVVFINEVDRESIKPGEAVRILVNAYPDTLFEGKVASLTKIARLPDDSKTVKGYEAEVFLNEGNNYRLKPGLSVRAQIVIDTLHQVFRVPVWCVRHKQNQWMVQSAEGGEIPLQIVRFNDGFVFVRGALQPGMSLKQER